MPYRHAAPTAVEVSVRRDRIEAMLAEGKTRGEIADALNVSPGTVSYDLQQMRVAGRNVPAARQRQLLSRQVVADLFNDGFTPQEIADRCNATRRTVQGMIDRLRKAGWDVPPASMTVQDVAQRRAQIVAMLRERPQSHRELAEALGVSRTTVTNDISYLRRHGALSPTPAGPDRLAA